MHNEPTDPTTDHRFVIHSPCTPRSMVIRDMCQTYIFLLRIPYPYSRRGHVRNPGEFEDASCRHARPPNVIPHLGEILSKYQKKKKITLIIFPSFPLLPIEFTTLSHVSSITVGCEPKPFCFFSETIRCFTISPLFNIFRTDLIVTPHLLRNCITHEYQSQRFIFIRCINRVTLSKCNVPLYCSSNTFYRSSRVKYENRLLEWEKLNQLLRLCGHVCAWDTTYSIGTLYFVKK